MRKKSKKPLSSAALVRYRDCVALQLAGIDITFIEMLPQLLAFLDWNGQMVEIMSKQRG